MNKDYNHGHRHKFLLRYHLILVCKYRRKLLSANNISSDIKILAIHIANSHNVHIHYMEADYVVWLIEKVMDLEEQLDAQRN